MWNTELKQHNYGNWEIPILNTAYIVVFFVFLSMDTYMTEFNKVGEGHSLKKRSYCEDKQLLSKIFPCTEIYTPEK